MTDRKRKKAKVPVKGPTNNQPRKTAKTAASKRVTRSRKPAAEKSINERIEQRIEQRLKELDRRVEKKKDIEPIPPEKEEYEEPENGDFEVAVKKLRPSPSQAKKKESLLNIKDLLEQIISLFPGSRPRDYKKLIDMLERMDEFGKVPDIETKLESLMMFLYEKYWRVETSGLENVPDEGRTLIVSNHSGILPFDGAMIATAIYKFHPAERYARFLIEDWFGQLPFATEFMNAVGQVRACQENAERLLRHEQLVGVFPEGIKGMAKGFKNRYNLARFGRGGVIRLAIRTRTPVVPCAVVGAEEIYIVLGYANWLGKMFGMPLFPITATFPWFGLLGTIPLPTKWYIQFGKIIGYDEFDEAALRDNVIVNRLNRQLRSTIQDMVDSALRKRRSLFFG
jgi:1-acyl-sn-glycerol-3-phosphate acyltransferase